MHAYCNHNQLIRLPQTWTNGKLTYDSLVFCQLWEFLLGRVGVGKQYFDYSLGESFHVTFPDFGIRTFEFRHDIKTLGELREDVHHRRRKQGVFAASLELIRVGAKRSCLTYKLANIRE